MSGRIARLLIDSAKVLLRMITKLVHWARQHLANGKVAFLLIAIASFVAAAFSWQEFPLGIRDFSYAETKQKIVFFIFLISYPATVFGLWEIRWPKLTRRCFEHKGWLHYLRYLPMVFSVLAFVTSLSLLREHIYRIKLSGVDASQKSKCEDVIAERGSTSTASISSTRRFEWTWRRISSDVEASLRKLHAQNDLLRVELVPDGDSTRSEIDLMCMQICMPEANTPLVLTTIPEVQNSRKNYLTLQIATIKLACTVSPILKQELNEYKGGGIPLRADSHDRPLEVLFLLDCLETKERSNNLPDGWPTDTFSEANNDLVNNAINLFNQWTKDKGTSKSGYAMSYLMWYDILLQEHLLKDLSGRSLIYLDVSQDEPKTISLHRQQMMRLKSAVEKMKTSNSSNTGDSRFDGSIAAYPLYVCLVLFSDAEFAIQPLTEQKSLSPLIDNGNTALSRKFAADSPVALACIADDIGTFVRSSFLPENEKEFGMSSSFPYSKGGESSVSRAGTRAMYFCANAMIRLQILNAMSENEDPAVRRTLVISAFRYLECCQGSLNLALRSCAIPAVSDLDPGIDATKARAEFFRVFSRGYTYCYLLRSYVMCARMYSYMGQPLRAQQCVQAATNLIERVEAIRQVETAELSDVLGKLPADDDKANWNRSATGRYTLGDLGYSAYYWPLAHAGAMRQLADAVDDGDFDMPKDGTPRSKITLIIDSIASTEGSRPMNSTAEK